MRFFKLRAVTSFFLGAIVVASAVAAQQALAQTWQEPTIAPPLGNVPPPIWNIATTTAAQNPGNFHIAGSGRIDTRLGINTDITIGTCNPGGRLCVTQNSANPTNYGIYVGTTAGTVNNYGVYALAPGTGGIALYGSGSVTGVSGLGGSGSAAGSVGVQGSAETGVYGTGTLYALRGVGGSYGVYASGILYAGYFQGNVNVTGDLTVGGIEVCLADGTNCASSTGIGRDNRVRMTRARLSVATDGGAIVISFPSLAERDTACSNEYGVTFRAASKEDMIANAYDNGKTSSMYFWPSDNGTTANNVPVKFASDGFDNAYISSSSVYSYPVVCIGPTPLRFTRAKLTLTTNSGAQPVAFPTQAQRDAACSSELGFSYRAATEEEYIVNGYTSVYSTWFWLYTNNTTENDVPVRFTPTGFSNFDPTNSATYSFKVGCILGT